MKQRALIILFLSLVVKFGNAQIVVKFFGNAQTKEIYTHPNFDSIAKDHSYLAILPFNVTINLRPNQKKKLKSDLSLCKGKKKTRTQFYLIRRREEK